MSQLDGKQIRSGSVADGKLAEVYIKADGTRAFTGAQSLGGFGLTNVASPSAATDAANRSYVDNAVSAGKTWRELVLSPEQFLSGASGGVKQAELLAIATNPVADETVVITDGTTTETFTFKAAAAGAFEVTIAGTAALTLANLIAVINTDSTLWAAIGKTSLNEYFVANYSSQAVIYRKTASDHTDRIYGTMSTGVVKVVAFNAVTDYVTGTESTMPSSDPAAKRFGFARPFASLTASETHLAASNNTTWTWGGDVTDHTWQQTDTGAITAGNGITVSNNQVNVNAGTGLDTTGGAGGSVRIATSAAGNGLTGGGGSALAVTAANTSIVVGAGGVKAAMPYHGDLQKTPVNNCITDDANTGLTITNVPGGHSDVLVFVNGALQRLGDGVKTKDCYFSDGAGGARAITAIAAGDALYWNAVISGFSLNNSTDQVDLAYDYTV